jgi:hypothetical protein
MNHIHRLHRFVGVVLTLGATALGLALWAPAAVAMPMPDPGGTSSSVAGQSTPIVAHSAPAGGMPGWEITLIALGAALFSAILVALVNHARAVRHPARISPA